MKKEGIEISVTINGVTKTTHMSIKKFEDERDAMDGIAPCDDMVYSMIDEFNGIGNSQTKPKVIQNDLVTQYMMGLIDKTPEQVIKDKLFEL